MAYCPLEVFFVDSIKMLIRNVFYMPEENRLEYLDYHHDGFISLFATQAADRQALRLPLVSWAYTVCPLFLLEHVNSRS